MKELLEYLHLMIDEKATLEPWDAKAYLNVQLAGFYEYFVVSLLQENFLLMKPQEEVSIPKMKKHMTRVKEKTNYEVALLLDNPTAYKVKKLLQEKIAFVAADKQMYLPFMALQIKQNRRKIEYETSREVFTAATQLIFLYLLYAEKDVFSVEEITESLKVSAMTVLRGMEELQRLGIVQIEIAGQTGRKKIYSVIDRKMYFRVGKNYLMNPVRKTIFVKSVPNTINLYKGGLTALAEQTMLGDPMNEVYATGAKQKMFVNAQVSKEIALEEGLPEIQLMKYDVGKLAKGVYVDPITLILSLKNKDDRTEIAIEELMEETSWYEE
ncbi:MAG: HTH domain-containing protein [Lachnospiraceae bacterium]|nr:HTH domain-containing protein [Lachnospiraceae bacterium]